MALAALDRRVNLVERKARRVVVQKVGSPGCRIVVAPLTGRDLGAFSELTAVRIGMAARARRPPGSPEDPARGIGLEADGVTRAARSLGVEPRQREPCLGAVVEVLGRVSEGDRVVAVGAGAREGPSLGTDVGIGMAIGAGCSAGVFQRPRVGATVGRWRSQWWVARNARGLRMGSGQGEWRPGVIELDRRGEGVGPVAA